VNGTGRVSAAGQARAAATCHAWACMPRRHARAQVPHAGPTAMGLSRVIDDPFRRTEPQLRTGTVCAYQDDRQRSASFATGRRQYAHEATCLAVCRTAACWQGQMRGQTCSGRAPTTSSAPAGLESSHASRDSTSLGTRSDAPARHPRPRSPCDYHTVFTKIRIRPAASNVHCEHTHETDMQPRSMPFL